MFIYFCVLDPSLNLLVLVISGRREKWKWVEKEREKWKEVLWDAAMNKLQGMSLNLLDNVLDYGISVQSLSPVQFFVTPWTTARQTSPFITTSRSLPNLMSAVSFSYHLLLLPSIFPTIRVFSNESVLPIRWPNYWSFSFNISPSSEHPGLISFRMDWLDLLAVQGTLKSLLQHHSSKHQFFGTQLSLQSNSHNHTWLLGKCIALTRQTFVGKVISLLFNMLSRDFPDGPVVRNHPCNAEDMGSIPGQGTKIPHAAEQLSLCAETTEPLHCK